MKPSSILAPISFWITTVDKAATPIHRSPIYCEPTTSHHENGKFTLTSQGTGSRNVACCVPRLEEVMEAVRGLERSAGLAESETEVVVGLSDSSSCVGVVPRIQYIAPTESLESVAAGMSLDPAITCHSHPSSSGYIALDPYPCHLFDFPPVSPTLFPLPSPPPHESFGALFLILRRSSPPSPSVSATSLATSDAFLACSSARTDRSRRGRTGTAWRGRVSWRIVAPADRILCRSAGKRVAWTPG